MVQGGKKHKKSTKNHGDLDNLFENLGWGAGSDGWGAGSQGVEQGARANLDLALILLPV